MTPQELEDRLIDFAVMVISVVEALPNNRTADGCRSLFKISNQQSKFINRQSIGGDKRGIDD